MTKHQIVVLDVVNNNPIDVETENGTLMVSCDVNANSNQRWLKFDANGGIGFQAPSAVLCGGSIPIPSYSVLSTAFSRFGYELCSTDYLNTLRNGAGTPYGGDASQSITLNTDQIYTTLYAQWAPIFCSVSFYGNEETTGEMATLRRQSNIAVTLPDNAFRKNGHTFKNWMTNYYGQEHEYDNKATFMMPSCDITLSAQWTTNLYTVKFVDWDDSLLKQYSVEYGNKPTDIPKPPTRDRYEFKEWDPSNPANTEITADTTFKAQYELNDPSILTVFQSDDQNLNGWKTKYGVDTFKFKPGEYSLIAIGSGGMGSTDAHTAYNWGGCWWGYASSGGSGLYLSGNIRVYGTSHNNEYGEVTITVPNVGGRIPKKQQSIDRFAYLKGILNFKTSVVGNDIDNSSLSVVAGGGTNGTGYASNWSASYTPGRGGKTKCTNGLSDLTYFDGKNGRGSAGLQWSYSEPNGAMYAAPNGTPYGNYGGGMGANGGKSYKPGYGFVRMIRIRD